MAKIGVKELSVPARALSIRLSAIQNKKAGNKLPNAPDKKIMVSLFPGICLKCLIADGNKTIPENTIRSAATWYAVKCNMPSFIIIKLLPQIMERIINISQFKNPLFNA